MGTTDKTATKKKKKIKVSGRTKTPKPKPNPKPKPSKFTYKTTIASPPAKTTGKCPRAP